MRAPPGPVVSPCVNICQMDETTGWCVGCLRTLEEIASWSGYAEADKRCVWQQLPQRRALWLQQGRGALPPVAEGAP